MRSYGHNYQKEFNDLYPDGVRTSLNYLEVQFLNNVDFHMEFYMNISATLLLQLSFQNSGIRVPRFKHPGFGIVMPITRSLFVLIVKIPIEISMAWCQTTF